jgi:ATP synthase subunit 6
MFLILFSPLEQFEILPIFVLNFFFFDISITNQTIMLFLLIFFSLIFYFSSINPNNGTLYIIPSRWQSVIEIFYSAILSMVTENIDGKKAQRFFPLIFSVFFFIALINLMGLVPYSYTVTSHIIVTLAISLSLFIGINIICANIHGLEFFSLFLPSGTPTPLAFLLVPIEFILYFFRPFSLAIRLFCNMMAGHILLKLFAGFSWSLMSFVGILFFVHYVPLLILFPLFVLEFAVALIQAFVFSLLICIYLNDVINLH